MKSGSVDNSVMIEIMKPKDPPVIIYRKDPPYERLLNIYSGETDDGITMEDL